jgi:hypothetical protein
MNSHLHQPVPELLDSVDPVLLSCREITQGIASTIPPDQFWRWKDMWSNSMRGAIFAAALIEYLRHGSLLSLPRASEILGSTRQALRWSFDSR